MHQTEQKTGFSEDQALMVVSDILQGLLHIHLGEPAIAFRDLNVSTYNLVMTLNLDIQRDQRKRQQVETSEYGQ
jgi:hypothetical protein